MKKIKEFLCQFLRKLKLRNFLHRKNLNIQRKDGLILFDYNKLVSYAFDWDKITIASRGIVFEEATGKIIAKGYSKFWNLEELYVDGKLTDNAKLLPKKYQPNFKGKFRVLEKVDGSCGIVYFYNGTWHVNTIGSFMSEQAIWAKKYLDTHIRTDLMNKDDTYIFEIIYPDNRIVVDYGDKEALILTGIIHTATVKEYWTDYLKIEAEKIGCELAKIYTFDNFADLFTARKALTIKQEGFVITFENGYKCKLKGDIYCDIHRKICNLTPLAFWRAFDINIFKVPDEYLMDLPEEFKEITIELQNHTNKLHNDLFNKVKSMADTVPAFENNRNGYKDRYLYIINHFDKKYSGLIVLYVRGFIPKLRTQIHRLVRPTNNMYDGVVYNPRLNRVMNEEE